MTADSSACTSARRQREPLQIEQHVDDELARAVIRHLAAAIDLHDRNIAGREHVAAVRAHSEREDGRMLDEPNLVARRRAALDRKALHLAPHVWERPETEIANERCVHGLRQSTIRISSFATSA